MEFSPQDVEIIVNEHKFWCQHRKQDDWVYGPERDTVNKTNPDLLRRDELLEDEKDKNRRFVRGLPRSLARAGFQIERY